MNSTIEINTEEIVKKDVHPLYFDSLNRGNFVKRIIEIIDTLATQKESMCYAIKGSWGVGKTHVLDIIEKELFNEWRQADAKDKYVLFHYNAWEYDYYDEPLFAMVTSMSESLEKETNIISKEIIAAFKNIFKTIVNVVDATTKIGVSSFLPSEKGISKDAEAQILDSNHYLNKTMKKLKDGLKEESNNITIIVVVDELDRCLPEYAIKVLERLHHIFGDMKNTQVILSVDYDQLENTVKTIFGKNTSTQRYLSKFINFSITLDEGHLADNFDKQFPDYLQLFDNNPKLSHIVKPKDIELFKNLIFEGIDMRQRKELVNKSHIIHTLVNKSKDKLDVSYMCIELILTLWKSIIDNKEPQFSFPRCFSDGIKKGGPNTPTIAIPKGLCEIENIYETTPKSNRDFYEYRYYNDYNGKEYINGNDIWSIILLCLSEISNQNCIPSSKLNYGGNDYIEYINKYWDMLSIIN